MRRLWLIIYYSVAIRFPTQPVPGWKIGYGMRRWLVGRLFAECGESVVVKANCYFGTGRSLRVGNGSQLGQNARIDNDVVIGNDVIMGPDVVIMTAAHAFEDPAIPINFQGALLSRTVLIGDDVWLGTRVVVMPGVTIGNGAVIGAGSIVTRDIPALSVAVGNPARIMRLRGDRCRY